jgi:Fe-S cluster assembly protein SufB
MTDQVDQRVQDAVGNTDVPDTTISEILEKNPELHGIGNYEYGWADKNDAGANARRGLNEEVVRDISAKKSEPQWMLDLRLKGLKYFDRKPMPTWGADLSGIDFDNIKYFVRSTEKQAKTWEDLPEDIRNTYEKLGIPEAERERLVSGVAAQYESEVVYHQLREDLEAQGVIFLDTDTGLKEHPEIFEEYFGSVIPVGDNKFASLNTAVWSGGSFVYVPKGVHVEIPLQAYFRINTENMGQFERTLIIADEDSYVHYIEGCTAPIYTSDSLHSAVVEIIVKKGARVRYTTIQNWSNNVYNLVTKRAIAHEGATMEWIDGNIGSKVTMKYPAVYMVGEHAKGETLSIAFAGEGQHQDTGSKMVHLAPNTSSAIVAKSVARGGGRSAYRGLVQVREGAKNSKNSVVCDALLVDTISRSDTYPYIDVREDDVTMGHEATVSRVSEEQLFYLMSRGLAEDEAMAMIVRGFIEPIARELPMEYALELNRLIELQMEGSVG